MSDIESYKNTVEKELERYFSHPYVKSKNAVWGHVWEGMKYSMLLPSKKLRAALCLEACRIFSGDYNRALPVACAIEMLQTQSLIHDDLPCMDNDDLRRGKPSNHKVFGEAMAILAGDALISLGAQVIIEDTKDTPAETVLKVTNEYLKTAGVYGIVGGQSLDIAAEGKEISLPELENIHKYKTGVFFEFALFAGSLLGGASEEQASVVKKFGERFGLAFQVCDDILDEISTELETGKTQGKDRKAQKATYVTVLGLEGAREKLEELVFQSCDILENANIDSAMLKHAAQSMVTMVKR
ncbi:geranylgeranyl diphosphate synthase, type II [Candidatus Gastranaerophilus sp. (ex Termes propinquus)]|nr:geranylgeranyl diphosphate synthase, type II [Candidatus Gastranaerophilus sp. (ex Termes propinquus)]